MRLFPTKTIKKEKKKAKATCVKCAPTGDLMGSEGVYGRRRDGPARRIRAKRQSYWGEGEIYNPGVS